MRTLRAIVFLQCAQYRFAFSVRPQSQTYPRILAGLPNTSAWRGTSFVTTAPAPTIAFSPIVIPHRIVAFAPIDAPSSTTVFTTSHSGDLSSPAYVAQSVRAARGARSFVNVAAGPTKRDFALTRWATVTGVVVSALDRKPVPGVLAFAGNDFSEKRFISALTGDAPKTDANGRFSVARVPLGKGKLVMMPDEGLQPLGMRDYTATEGQIVDLGTIEIVPPRTGDAGTFGLATNLEGDKLVVSYVKDGGPAAIAGVRAGDRITAINGRDVSSLTPQVASLLLQSGNVGVGNQVTLSLDRGGTIVQVSLVSVKW